MFVRTHHAVRSNELLSVMSMYKTILYSKRSVRTHPYGSFERTTFCLISVLIPNSIPYSPFERTLWFVRTYSSSFERTPRFVRTRTLWNELSIKPFYTRSGSFERTLRFVRMNCLWNLTLHNPIMQLLKPMNTYGFK